ncbi:MAG: hypothetical protein LEGION0403_FIIPPAGN_02640 [Legionella sp.]
MIVAIVEPHAIHALFVWRNYFYERVVFLGSSYKILSLQLQQFCIYLTSFTIILISSCVLAWTGLLLAGYFSLLEMKMNFNLPRNFM